LHPLPLRSCPEYVRSHSTGGAGALATQPERGGGPRALACTKRRLGAVCLQGPLLISCPNSPRIGVRASVDHCVSRCSARRGASNVGGHLNYPLAASAQ